MDVVDSALTAVSAHNKELEVQLLFLTHHLDIGRAKERALCELLHAKHAQEGERVRHCLNAACNRVAYDSALAKLTAANTPSAMKHEQITADRLRPLFDKVNAAVTLALSPP
jgi:hypothetical protein